MIQYGLHTANLVSSENELLRGQINELWEQNTIQWKSFEESSDWNSANISEFQIMVESQNQDTRTNREWDMVLAGVLRERIDGGFREYVGWSRQFV